jgi:hypothetical protein
MADNGQERSANERLDRMEATLNLLINDHVQFREEHKMLLQSQVLLKRIAGKLARQIRCSGRQNGRSDR